MGISQGVRSYERTKAVVLLCTQSTGVRPDIRRLQSVAEIRVSVTLLALINLPCPLIDAHVVPTVVDLVQQSPHGEVPNRRDGDCAQRNSMTDGVPAVRCSDAVNLAGHETSAVSDGLLQTNSGGTLEVTRVTVADPGYVQTDNAVNSGSGNESGKVLDSSCLHADTKHQRVSRSSDKSHGNHEYGALVELIGDVGDSKIDRRRPDVDRNSEKLSLDAAVSEAADDDGQEGAEAKRAGVRTELASSRKPDLGVHESKLNLRLVKVLRLALVHSSLLSADAHQVLVVLSEPLRSLKAVGEKHDNGEADSQRDHTLNEEQPSPTSQAACAVQASKTVCEQTTKGTGKSCGDEEVGDSAGLFLALVECAEVERQAWEQATLEHADEQTRCEKTGVVGYEGGADDGGAPGEDEEGDQAARAGFFKDEGGGDLEGDVGYWRLRQVCFPCGKVLEVENLP